MGFDRLSQKTIIALFAAIALASVVLVLASSHNDFPPTIVDGPVSSCVGLDSEQALRLERQLESIIRSHNEKDMRNRLLGSTLILAYVLLVVQLRTYMVAQRRLQARRDTQYGVAAILAKSEGLEDTTVKILEKICTQLNWETGLWWHLNPSSMVLSAPQVFVKQGFSVADLEEVSRSRQFNKGEGLPGQVWQSGHAQWFADLRKENNFPRASYALKNGLLSALAFPVYVNGQIQCVIEIYSSEVRTPDEDLLNLCSSIGSQIGPFIERMQALEDLQESEMRFRVLSESIPQIVWSCSPAGEMTYFNDRWFEYTGLTGEQSAHDGWMLLIHPDDLATYRQAWMEALNSGDTCEIEFRLKRSIGRGRSIFRWHLCRAVAMRNECGDIVQWVGTWTDIDAQKAASMSANS